MAFTKPRSPSGKSDSGLGPSEITVSMPVSSVTPIYELMGLGRSESVHGTTSLSKQQGGPTATTATLSATVLMIGKGSPAVLEMPALLKK